MLGETKDAVNDERGIEDEKDDGNRIKNGKYTVLHDKEHGGIMVLRNREPWRNKTGNKLILAMAQRISELENEVADLKEMYDGAVITKSCGEAKPKRSYDL